MSYWVTENIWFNLFWEGKVLFLKKISSIDFIKIMQGLQ